MIVCPNTSPLLVLARIDQLDLLGDLCHLRMTRAVLGEIHDKRDEVSRRVDELVSPALAEVGEPWPLA